MYANVQTLILHPENPISVLLDYAIAVTRSGCQTIVIKDQDVPAQNSDETARLKRAGRHRDTRSANAQHHRQEFLGHRQIVAIYPIPHHQQPSRQPLGQIVAGVASGYLRGLHHQHLNVPQAPVSKAF